MVEAQRIRMVAKTACSEPLAMQLGFREVEKADFEGLARLMTDAYKGTIEYDGETDDDAREALAGYLQSQHGPPLLECSYVAFDRDRPVSVTLLSFLGGRPLLAWVYTAAAWKNQGLAANLICRSFRALAGAGYDSVALVVTAGNAPAQHLYARLGFEVEGAKKS